MISENISHDSKVWTKEYDMNGKLLKESGYPEYDNLDEYQYVDIEYDRYEWIAPEGRKKEVKIKVGTKMCRFAQFPDNQKAIMPAILQELLAARKSTRKLIKYKTIILKDKTSFSGLISEDDNSYTIICKEGKTIIKKVLI